MPVKHLDGNQYDKQKPDESERPAFCVYSVMTSSSGQWSEPWMRL